MNSTKHFHKRDSILAYLRSTTAHPSAETIYAHLKPQIPDLAIGTVYRNLSLFKQKGLIMSVATVDGVERYDANTKPHVHFVCTDCNAVTDLHEMQVPGELVREVEQCSGGKVQECHLSFTGQCRNCLNHSENRGETA